MLFKALSREAAAVYELLYEKHGACPYISFLLVDGDPDTERTLRSICESGRDEFTASFLATYDDVRSEAAQLELAMVLVHARTSTVSLESSNATLRRRLHGMSLQVCMPELSAVSAEFTLGKVRSRHHAVEHPQGQA